MTRPPGARRVAAPARAAALLVCGAVLATPAGADATWWQRLWGDFPVVRIEHTAHGLVHLTAPDEASLGYGLGYAHAQDHGCETADAMATAMGERGRWFGAEAGTRLGGRILDNRTSDFFVRAHLDDVALEQSWNAASREAQALAQGVVDGYNRWLHDLGTRTDVPCAGQAWLRPMTIADLHRLGELQMVADGEGAWADAIVKAQPPGARPLHEPGPRPPLATGPGAREAASRAGGVALAFGRATAAGGQGLLLGNPHAAWSGPDRFWAVHVTVPGKLDALGVMPGTLPMLPAGFNRTLAWSTTRSPARHFTLHALTLAADDPTIYLVDGRRESMTTRHVRTVERAADGLEPVDRVLFRTRYGPVVVAPQLGLGWTRQAAYALQDADVNDARWLDTWLDVARAGSVTALHDALAGQGTGGVSVVAADAQGRVAFADPGAVPDVDGAAWTSCRVTGPTGDLWAQHGIALLDGSRAACDWHRTPGRARSGALTFERTPWLVRDDWVQSAGDGFPLAQPAAPFAALAGEARTHWTPLQGGEPAPLSLRTRAVVDAVSARLAGADANASAGASAGASANASPGPGPGAGRPATTSAALDADALVALWYDTRNQAAALVLDDLLSLCPQAATEATRSGCAALVHWDRRDDTASAGAALFREWWRQVRELPEPWRVPFAATDPLRTPRGLRLADSPRDGGAPRRQRLFDALAQAVFTLRQAGFALDAPLGQVQFVATGAERFPVPGGEAVEGTIATVEGRGAVALSRLGYEPDYGTSWLQVVQFGPDGPAAHGLLVTGQAGDAASLLRREALKAFADRTWFWLPFTPAEVAAQRVGPPQRLKTW